MAVSDRWYKWEKQPDNSKKKVPSAEHGKGKRWLVRWRDENGEQQKLSFEHKKDADDRWDEIKASLKDGTYVPPEKGKTLLKDFAPIWLETRSGSLGTLEAYERAIRLQILPSLGNYSLSELAETPSISRRWSAGLKAASSTRNRAIWIYASILSLAVEDRYIPRIPVSGKELMRSDRNHKRKIIPLETEQISQLADEFGLFVYLGIGLGLRQGEIFGLGMDDIDFRNGVVNVRRQIKRAKGGYYFGLPKGEKERDVPLPTALGGMLQSHLDAANLGEVTLPWGSPKNEEHCVTAFLFVHRQGSFYKAPNFNTTQWRPTVDKLGIGPKGDPRYGTHILRHTYASRLLSKGCDPRRLSAYLGHEDVGFTLRTYAHLMPDHLKTGKALIDSLFD